MSVLRTITKDPNEVLDYTIDWSIFLDGDTISSDIWTVASGITSVLETSTATTSTIWLSGGTLATSYTVANKIVTAAGRTAERTLTISIVSK